MKRLVGALVTILLLAHSGNLFSATLADGNELLRSCNIAMSSFDDIRPLKSDDYMPAGICLGTIRGILGVNGLYRVTDGPDLFCPPAIEHSQALRIIVKYLNEKPEALHEDGVFLAVVALREAFPCK